MEVIPVVNEADLLGVVQTLYCLENVLPPGGLVHLDVSDAQFTMNRSWGDPVKWKALFKHFKVPEARFEVHLMVHNPEEVIEPWLRVGAKRAIVHLEALHDPGFIRRACEGYEAQPMLAANPETPLERFHPYLGTWSAFQTLAVNPGLSGQKFLPVVLEKIKFLRSQCPRATIEVDGGINLETAMLVKAHGADAVTTASYVLRAHDPKLAFHELQNV